MPQQFCPKCGTPIKPGGVFCQSCGNPVAAPQAPAQYGGRKSGGSITAVVAIVCAVVILGGAAFFAVNYFLPTEAKASAGATDSGGDKSGAKDYVKQGNRYLRDGEYAKAIIEFKKAISIDEKYAEAYIGLSKAYVGTGDYEKAIEVLEDGYYLTDDDELYDRIKEVEKAQREAQAKPTASAQVSNPVSEPPVSASAAPTDSASPSASATVVGSSSAQVFEPPAGTPVGIEIGQAAPDFTLNLRGGGTVTLSDLRGKPVFLNVCTTWCPPCQVEFPEVQETFEYYGDRIHVLGVSISETVDEVDYYFDQFSYNYPLAYDPNGTIDAPYRIEFIPQTWVIDANGVIVDYIAGSTTSDVMANAIDKAFN